MSLQRMAGLKGLMRGGLEYHGRTCHISVTGRTGIYASLISVCGVRELLPQAFPAVLNVVKGGGEAMIIA